MKLAQLLEWTQAPLPRELQALYKHYWQLRANALQIVPALDPYICNIITPQIFQYLKGLGVPVQIHSGGMPAAPLHMWARVKLPAGIYIVDGSYYQAYYDKPISNIIPGKLGQRLTRAGITNLRLLLGIIDSKLLGEHQAMLDGAFDPDEDDIGFMAWSQDLQDSGEGDPPDPEDDPYDRYTHWLQQVAATLSDQQLRHIQGRLLPILLYITQDHSEHRGELHQAGAQRNELEPQWDKEPEWDTPSDSDWKVRHAQWDAQRVRPISQDEF